MRLLAAIVVLFFTLSTAQSERNDTNTGRTWESVRLETPDALEGKDQNLLRWALSHADPNSLNNKAAATKSAAQSALDLAEQRARILKFLQDTQQQQDGINNNHSEIDLMKHALLVLHNHDNNNDNNNTSFSKVEEQLAAMSALKLLVEQLDNANDLPTLGGLPPLLKYISKGRKEARLAAAAARVVAAAASNNVSFQDKLIKQHPEVIVSLLELITPRRKSGGEGGAKGGRQRQQQQQQQQQQEEEEEEDLVRAGLLATAAIIRNHAVARREFYQHQGISLLKNILLHSMHRSSTSATTTTTTANSKSKSKSSVATRKAVLALLADIFTLDDPHLILGMTTSKGELGTLGIVILSLLDQHVDDEDDAVALEREKTLLALKALIIIDGKYIKDVLRAAGGGKVLKTVQSRLEHVARHHERSKRRRRVVIWQTYDDEEDEDNGEEESGALFTELAKLARELTTHLSGNGSGGHHSEL